MEKRLETKQMKLTKETLKQIIREELEGITEENNSKVEISKDAAMNAQKIAEESKDSQAMQAIFDQLENNPEFMKAIQQAKEQMETMREEKTAGMMMIGAMAGTVAAWKVLYTAAGATAVAAAAPVIGLSAASGVAIGAALLAPIVIGFMMDRVIDVATGEVAPPEWAQGPKGEER